MKGKNLVMLSVVVQVLCFPSSVTWWRSPLSISAGCSFIILADMKPSQTSD